MPEDRIEKLLEQMGGHLSHMRGDLNQLKIDHAVGVEQQKATTLHLKTLNGRTQKNEDRGKGNEVKIGDLEKENIERRTDSKWKNWLFYFFAGLVLLILVRVGLIAPELMEVLV